ncbi:MAG TPA: ATP-grasp domain-containing protein [Kofleriaceae bacterium]|nr:ATP-grasp domain-containing protein [Kofleriaceae bacterium]
MSLGQLPWLVDEHEDFPSAAELLARVAHPVRLDPGITATWPHVDGPAVGYGTMRTMSRLARDRALGHAVFDDYARLRCSAYYPVAWRYLGRTAVLVPFGALAELPVSRMFGDRVFVRSDTNLKVFAAEVVAASELPAFVARHPHQHDQLAVASEVIAIDREYRCFCRGGGFACGSSYPLPPFAAVPDDVRAFAEQVAASVATIGLDPVSVDVAVTPDGLRLVEVGGVNSWGLYGADPAAFVAMMEAEALARWDAVAPLADP